LGFKKVRLLLSADAEKMVERYTPLAETAWIARLAQTVASLHFGWANGNDSEGNKRVITVSGGLTGRIRRKYFLNSLLGRNRELDAKITERLEALAALRSSSLPREEQKAKARVLHAELDELSAESEKDRADKRHHALDAMVLSFLVSWVNDPNREEEFRFTLLGDNPTFPSVREKEIGQLRHRIIAMGAAAEKAHSPEDRARISQQIIACRDGLAGLRMERNALAVRAAFRREIDGEEKSGIKPVLPMPLHFKRPELEATFHRGVWLQTESESRASRATIDDFDKAFEQERICLMDLTYVENYVTEETEYSAIHGLRRIAQIVPHKDYDSKAVRVCIGKFLETKPTEDQWKVWCASSIAPTGIKPKKGQPDKREFVFYKIEEKRTKRVSLFDLGVGNNEVSEFDLTHFEIQVARLVCKPAKGADRPEIPLQPDTDLQNKFRGLLSRIEAFYRQYPPDPGERPRKESARAEWQLRKDNSAKAWDDFIKETGLDQNKRVYLRTDAASVTDRRYEAAGLSGVLLWRVKRFDEASRLLRGVKSKQAADESLRTTMRVILRPCQRSDSSAARFKFLHPKAAKSGSAHSL
jgi:hypothetical protein